MRVEQVEVYQFHELSDKAKERARAWYRGVADYPWGDENRAALDAFADAFGVNVRDWQVGPWARGYVSISIDHDDVVAALSGVRLATYLQNNYARWLWQPKRIARYFVDGKLYPRVIVGHGVTVRERTSKCQSEETCCPFTGFCMDEDILAPLRAFIARPDGRNYHEVMQDCVDAWAASYRADMEHYESDEAVDDAMEANEYEFTVNGERW